MNFHETGNSSQISKKFTPCKKVTGFGKTVHVHFYSFEKYQFEIFTYIVITWP